MHCGFSALRLSLLHTTKHVVVSSVGGMCMSNGVDFEALMPLVPLMLANNETDLPAVMRVILALQLVAALMANDKPAPLVQDAMVLEGSPLPYSLQG